MTDDLNDLQSRIQAAKSAATPDDAQTPNDAKGTNDGIRAVTDLIATPIICGAIGMGIDHWFGTTPIFFIILAFLGVITGFWNLSRLRDGNDSSVGFKRLQNKTKEGNKSQLSGNDIDI